MSGDSLREVIDAARRSLPDVPSTVWARLESFIRSEYGATRIYIAAHRKRRLLEAIGESQGGSAAEIAAAQCVSVRRIQQLRRLLDASGGTAGDL